MKEGYIHSIQTMGLLDGPGIRVVVFFQGCPIRCVFCHNPDTWDTKSNLKIKARDLVNQIRAYRPYIENGGGVTFSGGEPLLQSEFLLEVLKLCKKADIPTISIHGLRHTHASLLLYAGVSIASVARRLGHASMTTTQKTYLHIIQELENQDVDIVMRSLANLS